MIDLNLAMRRIVDNSSRLSEDDLAKLVSAAVRERRPEPRDLSEWVYFLQSGDDGPIKIGKSKNVKSRLHGLQTAHFKPLHLLAMTRGGAPLEASLHKHFSDIRLHGEWFLPSDELITIIYYFKEYAP